MGPCYISTVLGLFGRAPSGHSHVICAVLSTVQHVLLQPFCQRRLNLRNLLQVLATSAPPCLQGACGFPAGYGWLWHRWLQDLSEVTALAAGQGAESQDTLCALSGVTCLRCNCSWRNRGVAVLSCSLLGASGYLLIKPRAGLAGNWHQN